MLPVVGCVLQVAEVSVERVDGAWLESMSLEVGADPGCAWVDVPLPPRVQVATLGGRLQLGDGRRSRLAEARFEARPRRLDGTGALRIHLPDLLAGDRAVIELERRWARPDAYTWRPHGSRWASIIGKNLTWDVRGATHDQRRDEAWVETPGPEVRVQLSTAETTPWINPDAALAPPSVEPEWSRHLVLEVPTTDPQRALYPGGGSSVRVQERLSFSAEARDRGWRIPAPGARDLSVRVTPSREAAQVRADDAGILVRVASSEGPADVLVEYRLDDAPTFGEAEPGLTLSVEAPGGNIRWEQERLWSLTDVHQRPILPAREALLKALDRRFAAVSIPEPGLPSRLRGRVPTWDLAAELVPTLLERATPAPLALDPVLPRRLVAARKSGVLTEVEAALITWLYAMQARLEASWLLVRAASEGPGGGVSLAGYDHALVQIGEGDSARWLDPSCAVCGPFEVRPELEGGSVLAPRGVRGPEPTTGSWTVVVQPEQVAWEASGPAALELRRWLQTLPLAEHDAALAEAMGGSAATLLDSRDVSTLGAPLTALAQRAEGPLPLPLDAPPARSDGTTWLPWVGKRTLRVEDPTLGVPEPFAGDAIDLAVDGRTIVLSVRERALSRADAEALAHAARAVRTPLASP